MVALFQHRFLSPVVWFSIAVRVLRFERFVETVIHEFALWDS